MFQNTENPKMNNIGIKIAFIWLLSFISCKTEDTKTIEKVKIAQIIGDLHWIEAKVSRFNFRNQDSTKVAFRELEKEIYKKHKTDSATFNKNYDLYSKNKSEMKEIYEAAEKYLEKKKIKKKNEKPGNYPHIQRD